MIYPCIHPCTINFTVNRGKHYSEIDINAHLDMSEDTWPQVECEVLAWIDRKLQVCGLTYILIEINSVAYFSNGKWVLLSREDSNDSF